MFIRILCLFLAFTLSVHAFWNKQKCPYPKDEGLFPSARKCQEESCKKLAWSGSSSLTFLYWQAKEDGLEYAAKNVSPPSNTLNINAKNIFHDFDWEPAFKVNLALNCTNHWDFLTRWTYYHTNSTSRASSPTSTAGNGLLSVWTNAVAALQADRYGRASSKWVLHYNTFDIEMGNDTLISPWLAMRLHGGLKGVFIDQDFKVDYFEAIPNDDNSPVTARTISRNSIKGGGPRIGLNTEWDMGYNFFLSASSSTSFLLQRYVIKRKERDVRNIANVLNTFDFDLKQTIWIWKPEVEFVMGLGWGKCIRNDMYLGFLLAYEMQYFYEENLFLQMTDNIVTLRTIPTKGDLQLHGVNVELNFQF